MPWDRFDPLAKGLIRKDGYMNTPYVIDAHTHIHLHIPKEGHPRFANFHEVAEQLLRDGVRRWVVVHFPEGAFAAGSDGQRCWQPSVALPPSRIAGANGAGDALAAGVLHGWHEGWSLGRSLSLGVAVAASCLLDGTCSAGIRPLSGCLALARRYGWRPFTGFSP